MSVVVGGRGRRGWRNGTKILSRPWRLLTSCHFTHVPHSHLVTRIHLRRRHYFTLSSALFGIKERKRKKRKSRKQMHEPRPTFSVDSCIKFRVFLSFLFLSLLANGAEKWLLLFLPLHGTRHVMAIPRCSDVTPHFWPPLLVSPLFGSNDSHLSFNNH